MVQPSRDEFRTLARAHRVVPLWRELLADFTTPVAAFARLVGDGPGFLLESVEHGERWSRWSFIGRNPLATIVSQHGALSVRGDLGGAQQLYERAGFGYCAPFGDYRDDPNSVYMTRAL